MKSVRDTASGGKESTIDLSMLARWVRWFAWCLIAVGLFFLGLYIVLRSPASLVISAIMSLVLFPAALYGIRAVRQGRTGPALLTISLSCWALALLVAARGATALPVALPLILLPVIFALPYVARRTLLKIALAALLMSAMAGLLTVGPPLLQSRIDEHTLSIIIAPLIVLSTGLAVFGLWYVGSALRSSLRETESMNRQLANSERELELKVQARTGALERAVGELSDIHEITDTVNVTLDLNEVITAMRSALQRVLPFDSLSVLLLSDDRRRLMVDHVEGIGLFPEEHPQIMEEGVPAADESSIFTAAMMRKHPILLAEIGAKEISEMSPTNRLLYDINPVRSLLVCPLEFAGESIGVLALARRAETMSLTAEEVSRVQRYIAPLAIVIRNARLLEEAEAARAVALESSRAKSQFLANMSHELRTPLNAIIGFCELLAEEAEEAGHSQYLADLNKIRSSGHYLLDLISGVLDLTRIEAGKLDVTLSDIDVAGLLEDLALTSIPLAEKEENALKLSVKGDLGTMHSDLTKVRQILLNLLSNACKFTHGGTIVVDAERKQLEDADWLIFRVIDSGIGMSPDQRGRIFEAFTQVDESTSRRYGGTGLGLTISKEFCELLGGSIEVASEAGAGSTFTVTLPARVEKEDQPR